MDAHISRMADIHESATIGSGVHIGPFCLVGPDVTIGDNTELQSHVVLTGRTTVGKNNRFFPGTVIGGEPQDVSFQDTTTQVIIGDDNIFREGVTVHKGAEKEDGITRIGNGNMFMANSHVAHNCHIHDRVILVNGVLLGGHVHVHDRAIVSGNSVVHHYSTLGRLSFVSGGCRAPHDVPPFMLAAGNDNPSVKTVNVVGMKRAGISAEAISCVRDAFKMIFRKRKRPEEVQQQLEEERNGAVPMEVGELLQFIIRQRTGKFGRQREGGRTDSNAGQEKAA